MKIGHWGFFSSNGLLKQNLTTAVAISKTWNVSVVFLFAHRRLDLAMPKTVQNAYKCHRSETFDGWFMAQTLVHPVTLLETRTRCNIMLKHTRLENSSGSRWSCRVLLTEPLRPCDASPRFSLSQDDIIDDVGDFVAAAEILKERGAYKIYIMATHGLLSADAPRLIEESAIDEVQQRPVQLHTPSVCLQVVWSF